MITHTMTPEQRRGRLYSVVFIATIIIFDSAVKTLLLAGGTLRWSQAVGTLITLIFCWYFWHGSKFAHGFLVVCVAGALTLVVLNRYQLPFPIAEALLLLLGVLMLALVAPATRKFTAYRRENSGAQPIIPPDAAR